MKYAWLLLWARLRRRRAPTTLSRRQAELLRMLMCDARDNMLRDRERGQ